MVSGGLAGVVTHFSNAWIAGPSGKNFQFHVGQQSWLSAREACLGENADLVTIDNAEELVGDHVFFVLDCLTSF